MDTGFGSWASHNTDGLARTFTGSSVRLRALATDRQAAQVADRAGEQLVVPEALEEGAVVVVGAENEAQLVEAGFGLRVQDEGSVGELSRSGALASSQQAGQDAVAEPPRGIRRRGCGMPPAANQLASL